MTNNARIVVTVLEYNSVGVKIRQSRVVYVGVSLAQVKAAIHKAVLEIEGASVRKSKNHKTTW